MAESSQPTVTYMHCGRSSLEDGRDESESGKGTDLNPSYILELGSRSGISACLHSGTALMDRLGVLQRVMGLTARYHLNSIRATAILGSTGSDTHSH